MNQLKVAHGEGCNLVWIHDRERVRKDVKYVDVYDSFSFLTRKGNFVSVDLS